MSGLEKEMFCKDWGHYLKEKWNYSIAPVNVKGNGQKSFGQGSKNCLKSSSGRGGSYFAAQYLHNHCTAVGTSGNVGQTKISLLFLIIVLLNSVLGPSGLY